MGFEGGKAFRERPAIAEEEVRQRAAEDRDQVRDEQDDHERRGEGVEVFVTACGRAHGFVLDGLALQWIQYQYAVCAEATVKF